MCLYLQSFAVTHIYIYMCVRVQLCTGFHTHTHNVCSVPLFQGGTLVSWRVGGVRDASNFLPRTSSSGVTVGAWHTCTHDRTNSLTCFAGSLRGFRLVHGFHCNKPRPGSMCMIDLRS